jgi:integrase
MSDDLISKIIYSDKLSDSSKKQYLNYIKRSIILFKAPLDVICSHPDEFYVELQKHAATAHGRRVDTEGLSANTVNAYVSAIIAVMRYNDMTSDPTFARWIAILGEVRQSIDAKVKQNKPSETQQLIQFSDVCDTRDGLPFGGAKLLLGMYTYIPPVRSDYARVRLVTEDLVEGDFINTVTGKMVIRDFKTSKKYGPHDVVLPEELLAMVRSGMGGDPDWLFGNKTDMGYNKWANRILKSLFGDRITLTSLRHSYISSCDFSDATVAEREVIASAMGHSVEMQLRYDWTH